MLRTVLGRAVVATAFVASIALAAPASYPVQSVGFTTPLPKQVSAPGYIVLGGSQLELGDGCDSRNVRVTANAVVTELAGGQMAIERIDVAASGDRGGSFGILRIQDGLGQFFEFDNPSGFALPFTPPRTETSFAVGRAFSVAGTGRITLTVGTATDRYDEVVDCAVTDGAVPFQMEVV